MSYDLAILGDATTGPSPLTIDNTANDGVYKLLQRVIVLMFTDASNPTTLGLGTNIPNTVQGANITDVNTYQGILDIAAQTVKEILLAETSVDAPDSEKIDTIVPVVSEGDAADTLNAQVTVTSLDGSASITVPITNLNGELNNG